MFFRLSTLACPLNFAVLTRSKTHAIHPRFSIAFPHRFSDEIRHVSFFDRFSRKKSIYLYILHDMYFYNRLSCCHTL